MERNKKREGRNKGREGGREERRGRKKRKGSLFFLNRHFPFKKDRISGMAFIT
jgi:hypothetical protein